MRLLYALVVAAVAYCTTIRVAVDLAPLARVGDRQVRLALTPTTGTPTENTRP